MILDFVLRNDSDGCRVAEIIHGKSEKFSRPMTGGSVVTQVCGVSCYRYEISE